MTSSSVLAFNAAPTIGGVECPALDDAPCRRDEIRRLAQALSRVKRRIHHPKLPNDSCYAGVAYQFPDPPIAAAALIYNILGPLPQRMSLDRIDPSGDYALDNLRYATPKQQTANRRPLRKRIWEDDD